MNKNNDSFSFDNDPGKMTDKEDAEFTFADIPVLGNDKKKGSFSLDQITDDNREDDPSIASFEALLTEQPKSEDAGDKTEEGESLPPPDASTSNIDVQRVIDARDAKKKKKLIINIALITGALVLLVSIIIVTIVILSPPEKDINQMTPEEKAALEEKKKQDRIAGMIASSKSLYNSEKTDMALASYKNVLRLDRKNSVAHTGCGKCYERLSNTADAKVSYQKAIDTVSDTPDPFYLFGAILIKEGEMEKALSILELGKKKFPGAPAILYQLGDIYFDKGDSEKSLVNYRKVPKNELKKGSIIKFGSILKEKSKKEAQDLFSFAGKKFKDFNFFLESAKCADETNEKVLILKEAAQDLKDNKENIDEIKFLYAKALVEDQDNSKAIEVLNEINISNLEKEYCNKLVKLAIDAGINELKGYCLKVMASNPNDIALQKAIQEELISTQKPETLLEIYGDWWSSNSNESMANYLYGMALGDSPSAKKYLEKAIILKPTFYEAIMALVGINLQNKDFASAERNLKKAILNRPNEKVPHRLLAVVKIRKGKGTDGILDYSIFLSNQKVPVREKTLDLFELSLLLPTSTSADKYLAQIKTDPSLSSEYKIRNAKKKLIFGGASEADFTGPKTKILKQYYILYLLSKSKYRAANDVPLTAEEHPAFWKIFILRKNNISTWKTNAELFLEKKGDTAKAVELLIISMWLEKVTLDNAEKQMNILTPEEEGLFYTMLAEEYLREKNSTRANIRFRKALNSPKSIYSGVIRQIYTSATGKK